VAETCDGSTIGCPADALEPASTVCRPDAGDCDVAESCTGASAACPADVVEPDGTSCDDAQTCTSGDLCVSGACTGESTQCGDGTTDAACNEQCDDGNASSGDGCSSTCQNEFGCAPAPETGCRVPVQSGKAQIQIVNKSPDLKDRLQWKWLKGSLTTMADFGNPLGTTDYVLCVYDGGALKARARVPAGGTCAGKPCWQSKPTGFTYKDKALDPDGVQQLTLKAGSTGKAKIQLKGTKDNLPQTALPLGSPVVVQLKNSDGVCWEATYGAPATKNAGGVYKDKAD
jgi:cysteine-rich repeat protein